MISADCRWRCETVAESCGRAGGMCDAGVRAVVCAETELREAALARLKAAHRTPVTQTRNV